MQNLQRDFLLGGKGESCKSVAWIKWSDICKDKSQGGLGVLDLGKFNRALLGKWGWKMLGGERKLWGKIICAKYGLEEGGMGVEPWGIFNLNRGWWGSTVQALYDERGFWFKEGVAKKVKNGEGTGFWQEDWLGGGALKDRFRRLFLLSRNQRGAVADMGSWVNGDWVWEWDWSRELRTRDERELGDLSGVLEGFKLDRMGEDSWCWRSDVGGYSVKGGYAFLCQREQTTNNHVNVDFLQIWNCGAIAKAKIHAWRVIRSRIPTRVELRRRKCLPVNVSMDCPLCGEIEETIEHVLFECSKVFGVWEECKRWLQIQAAFPKKAMQHFISFYGMLDGKARKKVGACIWVGLVWLVWNARNAVVFKGETWNGKNLLNELKVRTWDWLGCNRIIEVRGGDLNIWVDKPWSCF